MWSHSPCVEPGRGHFVKLSVICQGDWQTRWRIITRETNVLQSTKLKGVGLNGYLNYGIAMRLWGQGVEGDDFSKNGSNRLINLNA